MNTTRLGAVEAQFADLVWENAPLTTRELAAICNEELGWARTTTYTVLRKMCERGLFKLEKKLVSVLIPKATFTAMQTEEFVDSTFEGSLPAFVAAFTSRKKLSEKDMQEIKTLLAAFEEA